MKKIFAIALALVMVLSMASAFALNNCSSGTFGWTCPTETNYCGKGAVELVPYVKVNNGCNGYDWQISSCAGAVNSEKIHYAVKLTVEANADKAWWEAATLEVEATGVKADEFKSGTLYGSAGIDFSEDETVEYYLAKDKLSWIAVEDWEDLETSAKQAAYIFDGTVTKAAKAKICATLDSENTGVGEWKYGDYTVNTAALTFDADGNADGKMTITKKGGKPVVYTITDGEVTDVKGSKDDVEDANATFNLGCGWVCVTDDAIKANFGWDDEVESCFSWSANAAAVVDAECVVAIPKTGDVSVVAYAVMAVVAAAGTMLKK